MMQWKKMALPEPEDVIVEMRSRRSGLSAAEVKERLIEYGPNQLTEHVSPWPAMIKRRFRSSFLYLLLAAAGLSFFLGEVLEAALIGAFIFLNVALETYQEYHSEQSIRLLRKYLVSHVRVRRAGEIFLIESHDVVPGDILLLEAGDRLAADVRFFLTRSLALDESVVSGESIPVAKIHEALVFSKPGMSETSNIGLAGTVVTSGRGEGVVIATGKHTSLGDIAALTEEPNHQTTFEKGINHFSRFILRLVGGTLLFIFFANVFLHRGEDVTNLLIFSLALAVSVIPEALPVITTVTLSRGSIRLAQKKVVVKRLSAIEDIGSISVLCTDKTGTLTENALAVSDVEAPDRGRCLRLASIASVEVPIHRALLHDPFDLAIWHAVTESERIRTAGIERIDTLPFDPSRRRNSVLVQLDRKSTLIVRGAYEEVITLCINLSAKEQLKLIEWGNRMGRDGKRVLAVATRTLPRKRSLTSALESELSFEGMIAFLDPLKKSAAHTIIEARSLGIAVKIVTGDSRDVAVAVGKSIGLISDPAKEAITGAELIALSSAEQRECVERCHVFARVSPKEKYLIIQLLQEKHEVGFLGEGINDAPALKLANVGIVVQGAADIAKESADIVLLQHNLGTVIEGVREGRIIFANILKYLRITLTSNFGNFYSVALASLFLPFVPLLPIQILLLNLLSDFPMVALATDNVDTEELERPRSYQVGSIVLMTLFFGFVSSLFDFALFAMFYKEGPAALQTAWFLLSVITEIILIFSLRTKFSFLSAKRPSWALIGLSALVFLFAFAIVEHPIGHNVFRFTSESGHIVTVVLVLSALYFVATEVVKRYYVRHFDTGPIRRAA